MAPDLSTMGIDRMSVDERLALISAVWSTIPSPQLTPAQQQELDRRLDEIDSGRAKLIPYEQVRQELDAEFGE